MDEQLNLTDDERAQFEADVKQSLAGIEAQRSQVNQDALRKSYEAEAGAIAQKYPGVEARIRHLVDLKQAYRAKGLRV